MAAGGPMASKEDAGLRRGGDGLTEGETALRGELGRRAVEIAGEVGYAELTVQRLLERAEISRKAFYRLFADKGECYLQGEREILARLEAELRAPCESEEDWGVAFERSLRHLAAFLETEPLLARGVLVESRVAGGEALELRFEVLERLSHAVDSARRENKSRHSPPPVTARFITAAIEESAVGSLMAGEPERFTDSVADLARIATVFYFGDAPTADGGT
jgi:AcrR family transcriptional regulator